MTNQYHINQKSCAKKGDKANTITEAWSNNMSMTNPREPLMSIHPKGLLWSFRHCGPSLSIRTSQPFHWDLPIPSQLYQCFPRTPTRAVQPDQSHNHWQKPKWSDTILTIKYKRRPMQQPIFFEHKASQEYVLPSRQIVSFGELELETILSGRMERGNSPSRVRLPLSLLKLTEMSYHCSGPPKRQEWLAKLLYHILGLSLSSFDFHSVPGLPSEVLHFSGGFHCLTCGWADLISFSARPLQIHGPCTSLALPSARQACHRTAMRSAKIRHVHLPPKRSNLGSASWWVPVFFVYSVCAGGGEVFSDSNLVSSLFPEAILQGRETWQDKKPCIATGGIAWIGEYQEIVAK